MAQLSSLTARTASSASWARKAAWSWFFCRETSLKETMLVKAREPKARLTIKMAIRISIKPKPWRGLIEFLFFSIFLGHPTKLLIYY